MISLVMQRLRGWILLSTRAETPPNIGMAFAELGREIGGVELDIPRRDDQARTADFK